MSAGAYWGRNLAPGGIRWQYLSQPVISGFQHHARSASNCRGYEVAPPVGFEPTLTAPEGARTEVGAD